MHTDAENCQTHKTMSPCDTQNLKCSTHCFFFFLDFSTNRLCESKQKMKVRDTKTARRTEISWAMCRNMHCHHTPRKPVYKALSLLELETFGLTAVFQRQSYESWSCKKKKKKSSTKQNWARHNGVGGIPCCIPRIRNPETQSSQTSRQCFIQQLRVM